MPSFLTSPFLRAATTLITPIRCRGLTSTSSSFFHSTPARSSLKESDTNREDIDKEYQASKDHVLQSVRTQGKGKWIPELASNSEANVKADRGEIGIGLGMSQEDGGYYVDFEKEKERKKMEGNTQGNMPVLGLS
ncbi:hypothetical protein VTN96DRAFT_2392 [Rasamsonia emersonii]